MKRKKATIPVLVCVAAGLLWALLPGGARAISCRTTLLPNGSRYSCSSCHVSSGGGGARNPFGTAVDALVTNNSCASTFWGPALAGQDSDGDGRTNGEELGDPQGTWRPGQPNPGTPAAITNPGVKAFIRGDHNGDGQVDISDAVGALEFLFQNGPASTCRGAANANDDTLGRIDVSDAVLILLHLFGTGINPRAPFPSCGNSTDDNDCASYSACS